MPNNKSKCNSSKFKRLEYFEGMLLTEQDFKDEQNYNIGKFKLNNRLHGAGVVWGLALKTKDRKVMIEAGLALDCAGNEIIVCEDHPVPLKEKIEELSSKGLLSSKPKLYIGIKYCECESDPVEQFTAACCEDKLRPQYSRVREGFAIVILTEDEYFGCVGRTNEQSGENCQPCSGLYPCSDDEQVIFLGYIENYDVDTGTLADDKDIIRFDNPLEPHGFATRSNWVYRSWERLKLAMLSTMFGEQEDWVDVSVFMGKPIIEVTKIKKDIENMGLIPGDIFTPDSDDPNMPDLQILWERTKCALPWAKKETKDPNGITIPAYVVDIVTDIHGKCVIFPIVRPK